MKLIQQWLEWRRQCRRAALRMDLANAQDEVDYYRSVLRRSSTSLMLRETAAFQLSRATARVERISNKLQS